MLVTTPAVATSLHAVVEVSKWRSQSWRNPRSWPITKTNSRFAIPRILHLAFQVLRHNGIHEKQVYPLRLLIMTLYVHFIHSSKYCRQHHQIGHRRILHLTQDVGSQYFNLYLRNQQNTTLQRNKRHIERLETAILLSDIFKGLPER